MTPGLLGLYRRLPYPLRVLAASARGQTLRRWRYGPETDRLVAEALERESWGPSRWETWRRDRLSALLDRAATRVPYYRELWAARRRRGDRRPWDDLANWPILEKAALREAPAAFVVEDRDPRRMYHEHTSGTSGTPLDLWWSRETVRAWYALFEARCRLWHGVSRRSRWAILGGQLVAPVGRRRPPFWVWNAPMNQLYLSSYHLAPDLVPHYLDALKRHRVRYLWGYPSALHELARGALEAGRDDLGMVVALTNAEPVFDYQRRAIEAAFRCPVRETYGMAEIVAAASECPAGRLHIWPEVGWVEIAEGPADEAGELIATGLLNADMPLIRYRVGDRARPGLESAPCPCGRKLPTLAAVEGRVDDVLYTPDGRPVGRLDPVFKANLPVREAQIIQETLGRIRVRYVPDADFTPEAGRSIVSLLQARMGGVEVILESADAIPRTSNGKFRSVICNLPAEQRGRR